MRLYDENLVSIQSFATSKALYCREYCNVYIKLLYRILYNAFSAKGINYLGINEKQKSLSYIIMIHEMNA